MIILQNKSCNLDEDDSLMNYLVDKGHLVELRKNEFHWTKKHVIKQLLGLAEILPLDRKIYLYWLAFKVYLYADEIVY